MAYSMFLNGKRVSAMLDGKRLFSPIAKPVQLLTPTISFDGDILSITTTDELVDEFVVVVDGVNNYFVKARPTLSVSQDILSIANADTRVKKFVMVVDGVKTLTVSAAPYTFGIIANDESIDEVQCFETGMRFSAWLDSVYNVDSFTLANDTYIGKKTSPGEYLCLVDSDTNELVTKNTTIKKDMTYSLQLVED